MKYLSIVLLLSLSTANAYASDVYFSRDENGNAVFSDQPSPDAEALEVENIRTVPAFEAQPKETTEKESKDEEATFDYTSLSIVSPLNDQTVPTGHAGNVTISGVLSPGLRSSDTLYLLNRGRVVKKARRSSFNLKNLPRGEHRFQLVVKDQDDETLISSNPVTVHVKRASILNRSN